MSAMEAFPNLLPRPLGHEFECEFCSLFVARFRIFGFSLFVKLGKRGRKEGRGRNYATSASSGLGMGKKTQKRALGNWTFILGFCFILFFSK